MTEFSGLQSMQICSVTRLARVNFIVRIVLKNYDNELATPGFTKIKDSLQRRNNRIEITFYMVKKERTYIGLVDVKKLESQ